MYLNDIAKRDQIRNIAVENLEGMGIRYKLKKEKDMTEARVSKKKAVFKVSLSRLPMVTVTGKSGQQLKVPKILYDLCSFLQKHLDTEGIFRKEGSKVRQAELKEILNKGEDIDSEWNEIDVAAVLKLFLRELPEPLIPFPQQELFIRCILLEKTLAVEGLLLACLLLPLEHLSTLSFLMQFFADVESRKYYNKMTFYNLSIVIGPNVMRSSGKISKYRTQKSCEVFQMLAEHASLIGFLPQPVLEMIEEDDKKQKRRSGSLTRVFNGLKKIVRSRTEESTHNSTPDLLLTPSISRSGKKRKIETTGLSNKKKKEVLTKLPEGVLLKAPFTPCRTPISRNPDPKTIRKTVSQKDSKDHLRNKDCKEKRSQWYSKNKSSKCLKSSDDITRRNSFAPKTLIERRWSAVGHVSALRKNKKRNSCILSNRPEENITNSEEEINHQSNGKTPQEPDYVRISKSEYEEIKNKVTAIERRISLELDMVQSQMELTDEKTKTHNNIENVQTAYEQTLVQAQPLSPTTDHLARRLSKELKIRRSSEHKIIRSPSARKIGSMRRRSRELEKQNFKLVRHQSWHNTTSQSQLIPRVTIKKGKPNTFSTSEQTASNSTQDQFACSTPLNSGFHPTENSNKSCKNIKSHPSPLQKSESFSSSYNCELSHGSVTRWTSAEGFFKNQKTPNSCELSNSENCRPSLVRLRNQNAGMVLAKAKIFDNLADSDSSLSFRSDENMKLSTSEKTGGNRHNVNMKTACIAQPTKNEQRVCTKSNSFKSPVSSHRVNLISPLQSMNANRNYFEKNRLNAAKIARCSNLKDSIKLVTPDVVPAYSGTPKITSNFKKTPSHKSPKRLVKTVQKNTVNKVVN